MVELLKHEDFTANLNTKFKVFIDGEDIELELFEVSDAKITSRQEIFSILFRGPTDKLLPQQVYQLDHEKLSKAELFIVPIGQDEKGINYEVVFNRLIGN